MIFFQIAFSNPDEKRVRDGIQLVPVNINTLTSRLYLHHALARLGASHFRFGIFTGTVLPYGIVVEPFIFERKSKPVIKFA